MKVLFKFKVTIGLRAQSKSTPYILTYRTWTVWSCRVYIEVIKGMFVKSSWDLSWYKILLPLVTVTSSQKTEMAFQFNWAFLSFRCYNKMILVEHSDFYINLQNEKEEICELNEVSPALLPQSSQWHQPKFPVSWCLGTGWWRTQLPC